MNRGLPIAFSFRLQSENILCCGDHVSWHASLDGSDSRLQHMLMAEVYPIRARQLIHCVHAVTFHRFILACLCSRPQCSNALFSSLLKQKKSSLFVEGPFKLLTLLYLPRRIRNSATLTHHSEKSLLYRSSVFAWKSFRCDRMQARLSYLPFSMHPRISI